MKNCIDCIWYCKRQTTCILDGRPKLDNTIDCKGFRSITDTLKLRETK